MCICNDKVLKYKSRFIFCKNVYFKNNLNFSADTLVIKEM